MRYVRRLTALAAAIAAVIALGIPVPASAAPNTAAPVVVWGDITTTGARAAPLSYISNQTSIGIGVAYAWRGQWVYDAILQPGRRTDRSPLYWHQAESFYIGAGYCVDGFTPAGARSRT